jgi:hypothetical protein
MFNTVKYYHPLFFVPTPLALQQALIQLCNDRAKKAAGEIIENLINFLYYYVCIRKQII